MKSKTQTQTDTQTNASKHAKTFTRMQTNACWVVFVVFLLLLIKSNCLLLIRLLSKVAGKGNTAEISSLLFRETRYSNYQLTPLPGLTTSTRIALQFLLNIPVLGRGVNYCIVSPRIKD